MKQTNQPNPVVIVPVHRRYPTPDEQFSIKRCGQVLGSHSIWIVHPEGLSLTCYQELIPSARTLTVPAPWMASIRAYNQMMINPVFYSNLTGFTHVLIHEPDALVFSDKLLYWCNQPFDYIGAPWFEGFSVADAGAPIVGVGNSGFSLISLPAISRLFSGRRRWISRSEIASEFGRKLLRLPNHYPVSLLFRSLGKAGLMREAHRVVAENCDLFLARQFARSRLEGFALAGVEDALLFAWEVNPVQCYQLCNGRLPFGVHAWARYDRAFIERLLTL